MVGLVVSVDKSLMADLATVLSLEDLFDLAEIVTIDARNQAALKRLDK